MKGGYGVRETRTRFVGFGAQDLGKQVGQKFRDLRSILRDSNLADLIERESLHSRAKFGQNLTKYGECAQFSRLESRHQCGSRTAVQIRSDAQFTRERTPQES